MRKGQDIHVKSIWMRWADVVVGEVGGKVVGGEKRKEERFVVGETNL